MTVFVQYVEPADDVHWVCPYPNCGAADHGDVGGLVLAVEAGWSKDDREEGR